MNTTDTSCVSHQCGTCGRYIPAATIRHAFPAPPAGRCPQHGRVTALCVRIGRPRVQT